MKRYTPKPWEMPPYIPYNWANPQIPILRHPHPKYGPLPPDIYRIALQNPSSGHIPEYPYGDPPYVNGHCHNTSTIPPTIPCKGAHPRKPIKSPPPPPPSSPASGKRPHTSPLRTILPECLVTTPLGLSWTWEMCLEWRSFVNVITSRDECKVEKAINAI